MPFLVCDPYPKTVVQPSEFEIYLDGSTTPVLSQASVNTDGSVQLKLDLSTISNGAHTLTVKAAIADAWGLSESNPTPPFAFTKRDISILPSVPSHITISN